ncbi:Glyceraldehyde 3-phosphate dehydrogenase, catalytic domain,NAD(P)-binding [Cinara cedri]|uniref:Glyceraldehyde 3-phosphate dehydrogenase, catalytic domain,NAD(P)-binding n=1 Tax=Cinara cedri TaxID=506608 RepID=A0A5E4N5K5_9HEMI|nr:Glyceraldehyde 3-phosphate dehydrogenase, catalytic domain,NAD(P)-binding [Cinara cedri]
MFKNTLLTVHKGLKHVVFSRTICNGPKVAINGIGRIGKSVLRESFKNNVNIVAVNQPSVDIKAVAKALMYDTVHGPFSKVVTIHDKNLCIDGRLVKVFHEATLEKIPWKTVPIDYVIDVTGKCNEEKDAMKHINAGAKKVLVTSLSKDIPIFVKGVNFESYKNTMKVVSCGSSTGNSAAPLMKVLHSKFGILNCMGTTTHPMRSFQHIHDGLGFKSAVANIGLDSTGAAITIGSSLPDLKCNIHIDASSVPVLNVSLLKLYMNFENQATVDAIKTEIANKAESELKDVLHYVDDKLVSSDFISCQYSGVVDFNQIQVIDNLISIGIWYDNEVGYACRMLDFVKHMAEIDAKKTK